MKIAFIKYMKKKILSFSLENQNIINLLGKRVSQIFFKNIIDCFIGLVANLERRFRDVDGPEEASK